MRAQEIRDRYFTRNRYTVELLQFFEDEHLPRELRSFVGPVREAAFNEVNMLPDGSELFEGLRKLIEAKDAFIRQYLASSNFRVTVNGQLPYLAPANIQK